jgi:hypothetical protein
MSSIRLAQWPMVCCGIPVRRAAPGVSQIADSRCCLLLLLLLQGKPAASKGMDRLGGRSRVRTADESPMDYLPQVWLAHCPS